MIYTIMRISLIEHTNSDHGSRFVLGSFHKHAKLSPIIFTVWRNLAKRIPNSLLWVVRIADNVQPQIRLEAESHGVTGMVVHDQIRTEDMQQGAHLAARIWSDIALDTPVYNGHTTMAELLWSGVPTITCPGQRSMASRLATSLLGSVGLPALSVVSLKQYEDLATSLAYSTNIPGPSSAL